MKISGHVHTSANKTLRLEEKHVQRRINGLILQPSNIHVLHSSNLHPQGNLSIKCPHHVEAQIRHSNMSLKALGINCHITSHTSTSVQSHASNWGRQATCNSYRQDKVVPPGTQYWRTQSLKDLSKWMRENVVWDIGKRLSGFKEAISPMSKETWPDQQFPSPPLCNLTKPFNLGNSER